MNILKNVFIISSLLSICHTSHSMELARQEEAQLLLGLQVPFIKPSTDDITQPVSDENEKYDGKKIVSFFRKKGVIKMTDKDPSTLTFRKLSGKVIEQMKWEAKIYNIDFKANPEIEKLSLYYLSFEGNPTYIRRLRAIIAQMHPVNSMILDMRPYAFGLSELRDTERVRFYKFSKK